MKSKLFLLAVLSSAIFSLQAQILEPIKWTSQLKEGGAGNQKEMTFHATMDNGWHLYGLDIPDGGPLPTRFVFEKVEGAVLSGKVTPLSKAKAEYSDIFDMNLSWYDKTADFTQALEITGAQFSVSGYVEYQACNDATCVPPTKYEFSFSGEGPAKATGHAEKKETVSPVKEEAVTTPDESTAPEDTTPTDENGDAAAAEISGSDTDLWMPVIEQMNNIDTTKTSLWFIFISGFIGGLLALLTPCVWPMIPMTVSFFLKKSQSRRRSIIDALIYGGSIIVVYLTLGLAITAIFGASALNDLSTNAVFNLLFFALLVLFAVSFFGAFDITLPASWTTKLDNKAETTTGILSIFFMAFTLSLVSFSCTGPIIGTLLVQAASLGDTTGPAIGMLGFALALSIPFSLFAIFPSWMKQLPKSGGWLNSVKVVLGFLELALALKFLSVADLAYGWRILDREVFLVLWIVIFAFLGLYLLGKIRFSHDSEMKHVSVLQMFLALISFSFSLYMVPGLIGAPLKAISAFAPPLYTQDFSLYEGDVEAEYNDYEAGMQAAARLKKPVLIDFSGYGCVNCRKMEAAVWTAPQVKQIIEEDYVLITLMVDDKDALPEPIKVTENGREMTLRTYGDKWSYLQRHKFGANAQPYYV
ncbi:MAG: thioredoxin family protein, partial [Coprobacter sp.]|nr:thioredoxin family protein [Coprobacter sp.]